MAFQALLEYSLKSGHTTLIHQVTLKMESEIQQLKAKAKDDLVQEEKLRQKQSEELVDLRKQDFLHRDNIDKLNLEIVSLTH